MPTQRINYSTPPRFLNYHCYSCATGGVKLWRLVHATDATRQLQCVGCVARAAGINIAQATPAQLAKIAAKLEANSVLPAIPADMVDGNVYSYWGISSAPLAGMVWWRSLPLLKQ